MPPKPEVIISWSRQFFLMIKSLNTLTLLEAQTGLRTKKFSSVELTQSCLDAISKFNPRLNAFLALNPHVLSDAARADRLLSQPHPQPLLGIPLAIKDNFLTQGLITTASSKVLDNYLPPYNATVVERVKTAGALILGKTNMDAWAHGSSTETSDFETTKNPWNLKHSPGGSSGGSAAAVAANLCIAAIGSETAGSIRIPAAWCGVTGFKPTYGRVSRFGVIAMASSTDSPGPLAKTVADAGLLSQILSGNDPNDATTSPSPVPDYLGAINRASLTGKKIGLPKEYFVSELDPRAKQLILDATRQYEKLGAEIVEISLIDPKYSIGVYTIVQRSEVSSNLARYDGIRYGHDRSYFGEEAKRRIMLGTFALSSGYYDQYYNKAQSVRTLIINDFAAAFNQVDLIIGPVSPGGAPPIGASTDQPMYGEIVDMLVEPSSVAGLCGISVPCGFVDGLPIGMQVIGPQFAEASVLSAAAAYQAVTHHHESTPPLV
jgi:aspartyl-tRNA(Asn)/glutamyl-tRNA(Gln) amidotransferase subunit A